MPIEPLTDHTVDAATFRRHLEALAPLAAYASQQPPGKMLDGPGKKPSSELIAFFAYMLERHDGRSFRVQLQSARESCRQPLPQPVDRDEWADRIDSNDKALGRLRDSYRDFVARRRAGLPDGFVFSSASTRVMVIERNFDTLCAFWTHARHAERRQILRHLSAK